MAIISALLIAAVVAVMAAAMLTRESLFTRSLESEQARVQGAWALRSGLEISRQVLWDDRRRDPLTRLDQPWAQPLFAPRLSPRSAPFEGQLEDEQGKFNLRNLVFNGRPDDTQLRIFERLCNLLGVQPAVHQRIVERVIAAYPRLPLAEPIGSVQGIGGFDSGRDTSPNARNQPIPAKRPMLRSLDDLRDLKGLDDQQLALLAPHVTILPAPTSVNGNTASAEVLASQIPGLTPARARSLIAERDSGQWFLNRGDFINRLRMPEVAYESVKVGITSEWFRLHGQSRLDRRRVHLDVLLYRNEERMPEVIWSRVGV